MEELTGVDMIKMRQRKMKFALLALLLLFAACKAETPTAPTVGGGTPTGGQTPPTNATIALSASNNNPLVNSNVIITAKVTINNQNVPNGTAVQFATTLGTFTDTGGVTTLKITTDGIATATLTSAAAGTATVTATVNNSTARVTVTFSAQPVTPQPPSTTPTITSVSPTTGRPQGGEQVTITGTNFNSPVRVLFDPGMGATPKEAFVVSVSPTQIVVITPAFDVGTAQTVVTDVIVLTSAGTPAEQRVVKAQGFTFAAAVLTPIVRALQPTSGPTSGGTRVTIIGDAFQSPVQVFFGAAEAQVISVNFSQIIVMSPRGGDTTPGGSGVVTGPVDIIVKNINSGTTVTFSGGFRYTPKMQITTVAPTEGPFTGGTRIRIDGVGFDDPLAVVVGGVAAQVISGMRRRAGTDRRYEHERWGHRHRTDIHLPNAEAAGYCDLAQSCEHRRHYEHHRAQRARLRAHQHRRCRCEHHVLDSQPRWHDHLHRSDSKYHPVGHHCLPSRWRRAEADSI
jgi:hypothetical protein